MEQLESKLYTQVFAVTLSSSMANPNANPPIVFLPTLAQELTQEGGSSSKLLINKENLDRVLISRLMEEAPPTYPLWPFQYLVGCYARASQELRNLSSVRDAAAQAQTQQAVATAKAYAISYAGLVLTGGVIPEPDAAGERGSLQLFDSLLAAHRPSAPPGVIPLPGGFLEEFVAKHEDSLEAVFGAVAVELARMVQAISPLGDYPTPFGALRQLVGVEPVARMLVHHRSFLPDMARLTGRAILVPSSSWLGPFFCVSPLVDPLLPTFPSVREQCFSNYKTRRPGDIVQSVAALRLAGRQISNELHGIVKILLGKSTRDSAMSWLGAVLDHNEERAKMRPNPMLCASSGFFANLCAVLLRLCAPFADPSSPVFWKRVDAAYISVGRVSFRDVTKLAASGEEDAAWAQRARAGRQAGGGDEFHFVCEAFFITLKALHLGLVRGISEGMDEARRIHELTRMQGELEAAGPSPEVQVRLARLNQFLSGAHEARLCSEVVLGDPELMGEAVQFYRLAAAWMLRTAAPALGGNYALPLPLPPPMEFATLPEYFVEDMAEFLLYTSRVLPQVMSTAKLDELMLMLVVFIASPAHVRSPYLRSKLSEVLHAWLPGPDAAGGGGFRRPSSRAPQALGNSLAYLFEGHPLVLEHLVPAMLQLYVDVEFTDRANQFYLKFNMRQYAGDILAYLWTLPPHRDTWVKFAADTSPPRGAPPGSPSGAAIYERFANMLLNDATHLLDESLKKIKDLREGEEAAADSAAWAALSEAERGEREAALSQTGEHVRSLLHLVGGVLRTLGFSTEQVVQPFLVPAMVERVAGTLNYFLLYLTGPQRKALRVADMHKYNFRPRELLAAICEVYLHLAAADGSGAFVRAVATDARSYRPQMFEEAASVLRQAGGLLDAGQVAQLEALSQRAQMAAAEAVVEDEFTADAPDDFLDPITYTVMRDPVVLPSSCVTFDRSTIARHLLSDQRDPMDRSPLTLDQVRPNVELRTRIQEWIQQQRTQHNGAK